MRKRPVRAFLAMIVLAGMGLPGCAAIRKNMPSGKFDLCAFGACVSFDTRTATDLVVNAGDAAAEATGLKDAPAPAPVK